MESEEIKAEDLDTGKFIQEEVEKISSTVGDDLAINALSGGVDSSAVTMLAHKALGDRLKTYFIDNGIMREGEPEAVVSLFKDLGVTVELIDAKDQFFNALK
ncbi:MAG: asparagine synthase-related protein, partial [Halobacteriota archaeon]|nr:asparagine synthase-related protein [Halobacteriota archaeon]